MKKISLIFLLVAAPLFLFAQEANSNYPAWTISKDVHRFESYKTVYTALLIEVIDVSTLVSKNIHQKSKGTTEKATLSGYPVWTISKPVARQAAEQNTKKRSPKD